MMEKTEERNLGMHPKLLFDTIKHQAGTLVKANAEGIQNSIEAECSSIRTSLYETEGKHFLSISDDGFGIPTKEDIVTHFETFGTPHEEGEDQRWAKFRMGRGQMFAFGANVWRTSEFQMEVDIDVRGLKYTLKHGLESVVGTTIDIELYNNPFDGYPYYSIEGYKEALQKQVRYVATDTFFNDEKVNVDPATQRWDYEDEYAYYKFYVGTSMTFYNLGIYVMDIESSKMGMPGVVVSKKQLDVNFARNDILQECKVYNHILAVIKENRIKETKITRRTLTRDQRVAALYDLRNFKSSDHRVFEDLYHDYKNLGLISTIQGKYLTLEQVKKNTLPWSFAQIGEHKADKMMQKDSAIFFDERLLDQVGFSGEKKNFFWWLVGNYDHHTTWTRKKWENVGKLYQDADQITENLSDNKIVFSDKKLTRKERRLLTVLNDLNIWEGRIIQIGESSAAGWTDGHSYIAISKWFLDGLYLGHGRGVNRLMTLLAHEMAHNDDSFEEMYHSPEFYEKNIAILESDDSPTIYNCEIYDKMKKAQLAEQKAEYRKKEEARKVRNRKKLGLVS
jgi:hypothetical protein